MFLLERLISRSSRSLSRSIGWGSAVDACGKNHRCRRRCSVFVAQLPVPAVFRNILFLPRIFADSPYSGLSFFCFSVADPHQGSNS
ncbi:MAG: hypothetical protein AB7E73_11335 [Burkholderiales bacterium]